MNKTVRTPTLAELKTAGYEIDIHHNRVHKVAYSDPNTGKLVVTNVVGRKMDENGYVLFELLPKGGVTEVSVTDTVTGLEFAASARCRDDENYDKRVGVNRCLDRIIGLMLVCEWKNEAGFTVRLQC